MSITIELPPHIEARLVADAAEQGRDPAAVAAARLAEVYAGDADEEYEPTEEDLRRAQFIREWAEAQKGRNLPAIPLETLRRVNLLTDR